MSEASRTSPAFSPKMARSSFSSGVSCVSPFGVKIFSRKGIEKDDRAKAIEQEELDMMEKNLQDEIRILHDEVKKRVLGMLQGQELRADLYDEHGRERLLRKGTALTPEVLQSLPYEAVVRVKIFSRKGIEKDDRAKAIEQEELDMMEKNLQDEIRILHDEVKKRVIMILKGQQLRSDLFDEYGRERLLKKGT